MTLIIAAQGKDFIVLGSDSRETVEPRYSPMRVEYNAAEKIVRLSNHSAVLICGEMAQAHYIVAKFCANREDIDSNVSDIAEAFKEFCREEARELANVPKNPNYFPDYAFVIAGLDKGEGDVFSIPRCYALGSTEGFRMKLGKEGFVLDGKPMLAYYLFERFYKRTDKEDPDELCKLVGQTIYDTRRIDGDVGGDLKMALIRGAEGFDWIPETDVNDYVEDQW